MPGIFRTSIIKISPENLNPVEMYMYKCSNCDKMFHAPVHKQYIQCPECDQPHEAIRPRRLRTPKNKESKQTLKFQVPDMSPEDKEESIKRTVKYLESRGFKVITSEGSKCHQNKK